MSTCCHVVELRQYTLRPGQRDVLVELFDREFVESQEAVGMELIGQFRDLDRPDRFVWIRGFPDMERRREALAAFYGGPVWKAHAAAANATMIDVNDVLLLRPVAPSTGFEPQPLRPGPADDVRAANFAVTICSLDAPRTSSCSSERSCLRSPMRRRRRWRRSSKNRARTPSRRSRCAPASTWSSGSNACSTTTGPRRSTSCTDWSRRPGNFAFRRRRDHGCAKTWLSRRR
jgi:NIPSNAP